MKLRSRFLAPVPGPVDAVERQLDRARVDRADLAVHPFEKPRQAYAPAERGTEVAQGCEHLPVEVFGHRGVSVAVGVGKRVATRRLGAADAPPLGPVDLGGVADPVEARLRVELPVHERDDVARRLEPPDVQPVFNGQGLDESGGNPLDKLAERAVCCLRWLRRGAPLGRGAPFQDLFMHTRTLRVNPLRSQHFFLLPYGMLVKFFLQFDVDIWLYTFSNW